MIFNLFSNSSLRLFRFARPQLRPVFKVSTTNIIPAFVLITVLTMCQQKTVNFKTFDPELWKAERLNCTNYRNGVIMAMEGEFDLFLGMNEKEVTSYLGKPDGTSLYTRGQKFFSYRLTCDSTMKDQNQLRIRFSALDQVNEMLILD